MKTKWPPHWMYFASNAYRIAGNIYGEFNFAVCGFLGNLQAFLPQKFSTCSRWQYCVNKQQTLI